MGLLRDLERVTTATRATRHRLEYLLMRGDIRTLLDGDGYGYGHIIVYYPLQGTDWREFIQGELSCPMVKGDSYTISFFVSVAESSGYAVNRFGAYVSDTAIQYDPIADNFFELKPTSSISTKFR